MSIFEDQDLDAGLLLFDRSVELGPASDQARLRRLAINSQLLSINPDFQNSDAIKSDALAVAESYEYLGPIGVSAAENLLQIGEFEEAETVIRRTLDNNPNSPGVAAQVGSILGRLASVLG